MLLFAGANVRRSAFKDYEGARSAAAHAAEALDGAVVLVVLGEQGQPERAGRAEVRFVPFQESPAALAQYYQAADVYLHAARADTFPTTVLESLACGTPVVASAVGGIPDQIVDGRDGLLVDPDEVTVRVLRMVTDSVVRAMRPLRAARLPTAISPTGGRLPSTSWRSS